MLAHTSSEQGLFARDPSEGSGPPKNLDVPDSLQHATLRLSFPPSYVVVGAYRLLSDKALFVPIWKKCRNGFLRGAIVGSIWSFLTFSIQRRLIKTFWINSPNVVGLANDTIFGYNFPFDISTWATIVFLSSQFTFILNFFLSRNLRIARERAWDQTIASRGKGPGFWKPYVEEWEVPPKVDVNQWAGLEEAKGKVLRVIVKRLLLIPLHVIPVGGLFVAAAFKALDTARYLHKPYFKSKKMTKEQIAVFIAEHKWDYRLFGFTASLLETLPFVGLIFSVSNRIGAAMWSHDLEKRQHWFAEKRKS
ncbi:hypothetical protein B0F90DRAFT_1811257 [Multifurca ochricompacta]|uniref:Uncharacterized protein n=1 Tax=Multifurca ochricompacta TaxID=376703 RepID=A0AAD4M221_9AGAM|nr:hypothetical protein B0F90DRAFT_1811257 [Multifurca ochricompacta]